MNSMNWRLVVCRLQLCRSADSRVCCCQFLFFHRLLTFSAVYSDTHHVTGPCSNLI